MGTKGNNGRSAARNPNATMRIIVTLITGTDLTIRPKYLVTFTVGIKQKSNVDAAVKKMTRRRDDREVHKETEEKAGYCAEPHNDLVHGWGLDFSMRRCVEPAHEKMGVVDAQWVVHQSVPSLGDQGEAQNGDNGMESGK
ncbi:hypothetical protein C5167_041824 [Papaver somniferum]|nr:hypothetical protein C5167_041824 [Papaver somniferum]